MDALDARSIRDLEFEISEEQYEAIKRNLFRVLAGSQTLMFTTADVAVDGARLNKRQKHAVVKLFLGFDLIGTGVRIRRIGEDGGEYVYAIVPWNMPDARTSAWALYKARMHSAWLKIVEEYISRCVDDVFHGGPAYAHMLIARAWGIPLQSKTSKNGVVELCYEGACIYVRTERIDRCGKRRGTFQAYIYTFQA